jgi:hypothetical protein
MVPCHKKLQLMTKYRAAVLAHADAVNVWVDKVNLGEGSKELQSLQEAAKEARYDAEAARHELETHIAYHGC